MKVDQYLPLQHALYHNQQLQFQPHVENALTSTPTHETVIELYIHVPVTANPLNLSPRSVPKQFTGCSRGCVRL